MPGKMVAEQGHTFATCGACGGSSFALLMWDNDRSLSSVVCWHCGAEHDLGKVVKKFIPTKPGAPGACVLSGAKSTVNHPMALGTVDGPALQRHRNRIKNQGKRKPDVAPD